MTVWSPVSPQVVAEDGTTVDVSLLVDTDLTQAFGDHIRLTIDGGDYETVGSVDLTVEQVLQLIVHLDTCRVLIAASKEPA